MLVIENEVLRAQVKESGAELCSLVRKSDGKEYIWQADPVYWNRHAPTLFPVVGTLNPARGQTMGRHGFARDMKFECIEQKQEKLVMELKANAETTAVYPYDFALRIIFTLEDAVLNIGYEVENTGPQVMPFSIGAHPAFNCDLAGGNVVLEFEMDEPLDCLMLDLEKGLLNGEVEKHVLKERFMPIDLSTFEKDALVYRNLASTWIKVIDASTDTMLKVSYAGFTHIGIWSPGAPFVCIEPWYGVTDSLKDQGSLHNKEGIIVLDAGEVFEALHSISIL